MNKNLYDNQNLRSYLLGSASIDDVDRIDELSIADAEFADLLSIVEEELVDTYIQGELGGEDLRRFEEYYLASPLRREKVRFAGSFQEYALEHLADADLTSESDSGSKSMIAGLFASLGIFRASQPAFRFAMTAAVLLVVGLGSWLIVRNLTGSRSNTETASSIDIIETNPGIRTSAQDQPSPESGNTEIAAVQDQNLKPGPQPPAAPKPRVTRPVRPVISSFVLSPPLRGSQVRSLSIPAATDSVRMRLQLESDDFRSYTVELKEGASGRTIWRSGPVNASGPSGTGSLNIMIPAKPLRPAIYNLTVSGIVPPGKTAEIVGDYAFRVVP